jgi:hypothetical protein
MNEEPNTEICVPFVQTHATNVDLMFFPYKMKEYGFSTIPYNVVENLEQ